MRTIAIYNMKGGVGKTTTAVNLSYLAAESRLRVLLWDLDPQAASTFAFRIDPHVSGFGKRSLETGESLRAAIKETDYENLYLLPADFAYHKLDRLLGSLGHPRRVLTALLETVGNDFDLVFLDCPAGFSRLAKAVLSAADVIVAPAIPTVLSLRMVAELVRQAECVGSRASLATMLNMVDRRKTVHRQACELASEHPDIFLRAEIPYASVVEQMAARRAPTAVYAAQTPAAAAFARVWGELQSRLAGVDEDANEGRWSAVLHKMESLIERLEPAERRPSGPVLVSTAHEPSPAAADGSVVHRFDTEQRDLEHRGRALELHERPDGGFLVLARCDASPSRAGRAEVCIDRSWTVQILAGKMSPLDALERRIRAPRPRVVELVREAANGRQFLRVQTFRAPLSPPLQALDADRSESPDATDWNRAAG